MTITPFRLAIAIVAILHYARLIYKNTYLFLNIFANRRCTFIFACFEYIAELLSSQSRGSDKHARHPNYRPSWK